MRFPPCFFSAARAFAPGLLAVAVLIAGSGCFNRGARGDYALAPEMRPLEVPPDLSLPDAGSAVQVPALASVVRPAASPSAPTAAAPAGGFVVSGSREEVYDALGQALAAASGVNIVSRSQMLASYDVAFEDSRFLVRVAATEAGSRVSAVDARGLPVTGAAAEQLLEMLKRRFGG